MPLPDTKWIPAAHLRPGMRIRNASYLPFAPVERIVHHECIPWAICFYYRHPSHPEHLTFACLNPNTEIEVEAH